MKALVTRAVATISLSTMLLVPGFAFAADPNYNAGIPQNVNELFLGPGVTTDVNTLLPKGSNRDPRTIVSNLIGIISGFLGIVAVVIILISGFQWMTAGGDEEAVKTAQKRLVQGVIGLILILSTWSVAYYVVNTLSATLFKA